MIVRHVRSQVAPSVCTATQRSWVYRTEIENNHDRPVRVVWFEFYYLDGENWFGINVRNRPLRSKDFVEWYGDGPERPDRDGWIAPGQTVICDPNYSWAFGDELSPIKWSFLAVDSDGNDYFGEALVTQDAVSLYNAES